MFKVTFRYADEWSKGEWRYQTCTLFAPNEKNAVDKCIALYGLGTDCIYHILSVEKVGD